MLVAPVDWRQKIEAASRAKATTKAVKKKKKGKKKKNPKVITSHASLELSSVLLIDWEFSVEIGDAAANAPLLGTAMTMSQRQLLAGFSESAVTRVEAASDPDLSAEEDDSDLEQMGAETVSAADSANSTSRASTTSTVPSSDFVYGVQDELEAAVRSILLILSPALKRRVKQKATTAPHNQFDSQQRHQHLHAIWERVLPTHVLGMCADAEYTKLATWLKTALLHFDPEEEQDYITKFQSCHG
jgi:hypothetical protein